MKFVLALFGLVALTNAHLCFISPHQRGSMVGINTPAADDCLLVKNPPCGGRQSEAPITGFKSGVPVCVTFQKNLDHFNPSNPGNFMVSIAKTDSDKFDNLYKVDDSKTPSLHLYTANITIPDSYKGNAVLQATYTTNNPNAPAVFYQCADILVA